MTSDALYNLQHPAIVKRVTKSKATFFSNIPFVINDITPSLKFIAIVNS